MTSCKIQESKSETLRVVRDARCRYSQRSPAGGPSFANPVWYNGESGIELTTIELCRGVVIQRAYS